MSRGRISSRYWSPLAARCAFVSSAAILAVGLVLSLASGGMTAASAFLLAAAAYLIIYAASLVLFSQPLHRARERIVNLRNHRSEQAEPQSPPRDEIQRLNWQIHRTGIALENEISNLRRLEDYRREFLGNVSHELKTPIFTIMGFAETLRDGALEDADVNRAFVQKIYNNAERLSLLSRDLAEISRLESGELTLQIERLDLPKLIHEVAESLELRALRREIDLVASIPMQVVQVQGDRERLRQVIVNLVDNAIKYTDVGGRVEIRLEQTNGAVRVSVIDNGIGVDAADLPRLTERFYRVDRSRSREQGGTGLGLAIVKHILAAHGMQLDVESAPGEGSTFSFLFAPEMISEGR